MKVLIICLLVSSISLTFAVPAFNFDSVGKLFQQRFSAKEQNKDEVNALFQTLVSTEDDQDPDDDEDDGTV